MVKLIDFIGLHGVTPEQVIPESELYVDSLPGISSEMAVNVANTEVETLWSNVQATAYSQMSTEVKAYLQSKANFFAKDHSTRLNYRKTKEVINTSGVAIGQFFVFPKSSYTSVRVDSVELFTEVAAVINLRQYDEKTEALTFLAENVSLSAGYNIVPVNKLINVSGASRRIFIGVSQVMEGAEEAMTLRRFTTDYRGECVVVECNCEYGDFYYYPATFNFEEGIKQASDQFGLIVNLHMGCSDDLFIEVNKSFFAYAFQLLLAATLLDFKINSFLSNRKLNFFTATNLEETKTKKEQFLLQYREALQKSLEGISMRPDDYCFDCQTKQLVSYRMVSI